MAKTRWHIVKDGQGGITLSRQLPARFDFAVAATVPACHPVRLAHQVRQDMWRALQGLRGFLPVVEIVKDGNQMYIRAGGAVQGSLPLAYVQGLVSQILHDPKRRARWIMHAGRAK
ncbi:hypothetical protein [Donghicola sp. XS_ASV15]|uniref:hypothetical protein n=1 Tax=Donghicola sp. XS_ASV15 TaxID=3241295 RepID=UPI003515EB7F